MCDVLSIPRGNGNRTKYSEKVLSPKKQKSNKNKRGRKQLLGKCAWLLGRMHIKERLNKEPWLQWKQKDENEAKQT